MENRFEPLDGDEVLSVDESFQILIGHRTFRVGEIATALKMQLLEYGIGGITTEKEGWFNPDGIPCEALKFGASRWLKGRVKISIDFCPDTVQTPSRPPAAAATPVAAPQPAAAVIPPVAPPVTDELVTADQDTGALDDDLLEAVTMAEPELEEVETRGEAETEDWFSAETEATEELALDDDLETLGDEPAQADQAAAEFWDEADDDELDFAAEAEDELGLTVGGDEDFGEDLDFAAEAEDEGFGDELDDFDLGEETAPEAIAPNVAEEEDLFGADDEDDPFGEGDDPFGEDLEIEEASDALVDDVFENAPTNLTAEGDDDFDLGGDIFGSDELEAEDDGTSDDSLFDISDEDEFEAGVAASGDEVIALEDAEDIFGDDDDTDWGLSGDDEDDLFGTTVPGNKGEDVIADIWQDIDELS